MFTVTGFLDGSAYAVSVDAPSGHPVVGSLAVERLIETRAGEPYDATVTGPSGKLDLEDPESILGALYAWTRVTSVEGDAPDIGLEEPDPEPGLTY